MFYPVRTPALFRLAYRHCVWDMPNSTSAVYLTFDDGPHPEITPWVLDQLRKWNVKASFFCIGDNVRKYPDLLHQIKMEGHSIGNHTFHHLNGWKTADDVYRNDIDKAQIIIPSKLFRPPYGRIRFSQLRALRKETDYRIIMWSLLSGDFDHTITPQECARNVIDNIRKGDIVVFHDSAKARQNLVYTLPLVLKNMYEKGMEGKALLVSDLGA